MDRDDATRDPIPEDRRAFLKKVARGTIYAAPFVRALTTPDALLAGGQGKLMSNKGMGGGMTNQRGIPTTNTRGGRGPTRRR